MSRQIYTSVLVVLVFLIAGHLKAQITCNSFCITDIQKDTILPKIKLDREGLTEGLYYLKMIDKKYIGVKMLLIIN